MNKFWQLVVKIRNFGHQMSIKHYGKQGAGSDYKFKFLAFTSGYVLALYFIVFQTILYFYDGPILPTDKTDPWPFKLLAAIVFIYLPMKLLNHLLLKKIEHIPLPMEFNKEKYGKYILVYWATFLLGHFLWLTIGIFLMSHLRGIEIR